MQLAVVRRSIHDAKPSFSQRSSHQRIVTRSPNHWCAISCAAMANTPCAVGCVESAGSIRRARSKLKIAPQFSIAPKNWLLPGDGDVVELGQRIRQAEVVVVLAQDVALATRARSGACAAAPRRVTTPISVAPGLARRALEVADAEEEQVGRHRRRGREAHACAAVAPAAARRGGGMLLTAICAAGTVASKAKVAL